MATRPAVLEAKLEKLAAVIADGNDRKRTISVDEARADLQAAVEDVLAAGGSVAAVEAVELPSERE